MQGGCGYKANLYTAINGVRIRKQLENPLKTFTIVENNIGYQK